MVGVERRRAGVRAFLGGAEGGVWAMLGGRVCDVVVTPCDLRRLELALLAGVTPLLLLCQGPLG